jgi:predicted PurR-regulated permease PerM
LINLDKHKNRSEKRFMLAQRMTYTMLAIILFMYGLIAIRNFLYPVAFGFLLAYLLLPMVSWLEKRRVPRILASFITIIGVLSILVLAIFFAYNRIAPISGELPSLIETGIKNLSRMIAVIGEYLGFDRNETKQIIQNQTQSLLDAGGQNIQNVFAATASTLVAIGLLPVYIFLFLYYRTKFAYFLLKIVNPEHKRTMLEILREVSKVSAKYIGGVIIVVMILCVINSLGLWIIGMRFPVALGIISAVFNFIPYFGTLLGGLVPLLFALLVENDPILTFRVVILFIIIQFTENNILTPNIVGSNVKINPFFIITGLVAASMVWGIPGMLLIVPFLAITRIVFAHIDSMRPYAFLLGKEGTSKHSLTLKKIKNLWPWGKKQK